MIRRHKHVDVRLDETTHNQIRDIGDAVNDDKGTLLQALREAASALAGILAVLDGVHEPINLSLVVGPEFPKGEVPMGAPVEISTLGAVPITVQSDKPIDKIVGGAMAEGSLGKVVIAPDGKTAFICFYKTF